MSRGRVATHMNIHKMRVESRSIKIPVSVAGQGTIGGGVDKAPSPHDKFNTARGFEAKIT